MHDYHITLVGGVLNLKKNSAFSSILKLGVSSGKAEDAPTLRCSTDTTDTLFNFDISSNIPQKKFPMDAEDSPWGGT